VAKEDQGRLIYTGLLRTHLYLSGGVIQHDGGRQKGGKKPIRILILRALGLMRKISPIKFP